MRDLLENFNHPGAYTPGSCAIIIMKSFPWSLRSSLVAVLLPPVIALLLFLGILHVAMPDSATVEQFYGVSRWNWLKILFGVVPALTVILVFAKGYWRFSLILLFTAFTVAFLYAMTDDTRTPTDLRIVNFGYFLDGTDIYCNDVNLGKAPMKISVGELKKKVPVWTTPPEQHWFLDGRTPLYTQIPWDDFIRERNDARIMLDPKKSTLTFDAKSSYWWRFEYRGTKACSFGTRHDGSDYDKTSEYWFAGYSTPLFPSKWAYGDLLLGVLKDDGGKPSPEWIDHVAKYSDHLKGILYNQDGKPLEENVLTAIAKRRYGLSETPTPEECEKAIDQILKENETGFYFSPYALPGKQSYSSNVFGGSSDCRDILVKHAIRAMGPACKEPLLRRFRNTEPTAERMRIGFMYSNAMTYMMGEYCFPEAFEDVVCRYATEREGFRNLMKYPDTRLVPLLETLLVPGVNPFPIDNKGHEEFRKSLALVVIENKMLEPMIRERLAELLPKCGYNNVADVLKPFAETRLKFDGANREELIDWIEGLHIEGRYKTDALRILRKLPDSEETLGQSIILESPLTQKLTEASLKAWIEKNPDRMLEDLFVDMDPALTDDAEMLKPLLIEKVIRRNKSEAKEIIGLLWKNPDYRNEIIRTVQKICGTAEFALEYDALGSPKVRRVRLPGTYVDMNLAEGDFKRIKPEKKLPEYFVALFDEPTDPKVCVGLPSLLADVETPEAVALLKKWSSSSSSLLKRRATESLDILSARMKLKEDRRKLFADLVAGKITPDDLLLPTKPFVWDGEKYVRKN